MATTTKKELIDRIAGEHNLSRAVVQKVIESYHDSIIHELSMGNRLEFRDFGVFETRERDSRLATNPKTLERVRVPPTRTVKFKPGKLMKEYVSNDKPIPNGIEKEPVVKEV